MRSYINWDKAGTWWAASVISVLTFVGAIATGQFYWWFTPLLLLVAAGAAWLAVVMRQENRTP